MNYTKEQEQAIFLRDKNIMVSAGAGAGKTRVLVSRMAELIMDEKNPVEADRFLVMTFTNAAAAEMKERISLDLEERLAKDPEKQDRLATVLYNLVESISYGAALLEPFMPSTSRKILEQLNAKPDRKSVV